MADQNSRKVYAEIIEEGLVGELQGRVLGAIAQSDRPPTVNEIGKYIGVTQRTTYAPRVKELEDMGVIRKTTKRPCSITGRTGYTFELTGRKPKHPEKKQKGTACLFCKGTGLA